MGHDDRSYPEGFHRSEIMPKASNGDFTATHVNSADYPLFLSDGVMACRSGKSIASKEQQCWGTQTSFRNLSVHKGGA